MDRKAWWVTVHGGHKEADMAEYIHLYIIELPVVKSKYHFVKVNIFDKKLPTSLSILLSLEKVCYDCVKMLLKDNIWQIRFAFLGVKKVTILSTLKALSDTSSF